jgi:AcrR family transcriptional regulator
MPMRRAKTRNVREDCLRAALAIIARHGIEQLSLREVARRLGVSHQAPYKHFASRDHLVAEIVARAFQQFARHLDGRPRHDDPRDDLRTLGEAYLTYARAHPLEYRLMFATPLPDPRRHPAMMETAQHAFSLLHTGLTRLHEERGTPGPAAAARMDALYVWSNMHGLASILASPALATLDLPSAVLRAIPEHVMEKVGAALES